MKLKKFGYITIILLTATSCSQEMKSKIGLSKKAPDEFSVISGPPLSVPPDFELRPPLNELDSLKTKQKGSDDLKTTLFNEKESLSKSTATQSQGETILLNKIGSNAQDHEIRTILIEEQYFNQKEKESKIFKTDWLDSITPWGKKDKKEVVNPIEEKNKLDEKK